MKNDELLHKWVNGQLTAAELDRFKQRPEYEALEKLRAKTDQLEVPAFAEAQMLADILAIDKKAKPPTTGKRRTLSRWAKYAAAAAVLLLAGWFFWPTAQPVTWATGQQEQQEGRLPDGSTFRLNAESALTYQPKTWAAERRVELTGEAFFNVEKGQTFTVYTTNGTVAVLGTTFNVWSRDNTLEVSCQTGKVAVTNLAQTQRHVLLPQEAIRLTAGKVTMQWTTPANDPISWMAGVSKFRQVPLATVLAALERQFGVRIDARAVDTTTILSCNFDHQDLDLALKTTLTPLVIRYVLHPDKTVVLYAQ